MNTVNLFSFHIQREKQKCPAMFRGTVIHILNPLCLYNTYRFSILFHLFILQLIKGFVKVLYNESFPVMMKRIRVRYLYELLLDVVV